MHFMCDFEGSPLVCFFLYQFLVIVYLFYTLSIGIFSKLFEEDCFMITNPHKPGVFLWDISKQNSAIWDAAKRRIPSGAILFTFMNFIEK